MILCRQSSTVLFFRNKKYEGTDCEFTRLVSKEVTDRRRIPTATPVNIYDDFMATEFAAALQSTKPGKAL